jgi:hypothetical protein
VAQPAAGGGQVVSERQAAVAGGLQRLHLVHQRFGWPAPGRRFDPHELAAAPPIGGGFEFDGADPQPFAAVVVDAALSVAACRWSTF